MTDEKRFGRAPKPAEVKREVPIIERDAHETVPTISEEERAAKAEQDQTRAAEVLDRLKQQAPGAKTINQEPYLELTYGEFVDDVRDTQDQISLDPENVAIVEKGIVSLKTKSPMLPRLASGVPIAADYNIRVGNYSTQTDIIELSDGRRVFAIHAYTASVIHRALDGLMKWASGLKMHKVSRSKWKDTYEAKSNVPVIASKDPHVVLLPYLKNVNAYDLFANNHDMSVEDFGDMAWAHEVGIDQKLDLADSIVDELRRVHEQGKVWGEVILPNVIFTAEEKQPVICDPEVVYNKDVETDEAKARDLKDLIHSVCGALARSEKMEDLEGVVKRLMDRYQDQSVIDRLQELSRKKRTVLQKLTFGYEKVRSGATDQAEYIRVIKAISQYQPKQSEVN